MSGRGNVLPKNPLIALTAIRLSTFGLSAVGICSSAKTEKQTKYSFLLPKVSDKGARTRGPRPRKTTKPVVAPTTTSLEVPRSAAISPMPGVNMLEASGERTRCTISIYSIGSVNDQMPLTGHEGYYSHIDHLTSLGPVSGILIVLFGEIDDLNIYQRKTSFKARIP